MKSLKTKEEIEIMAEGGKRLFQVLNEVASEIKVGITTSELDKLADKKIIAAGGKPCFKMVADYRWATCITINDEVVHGIPDKRAICAGDLVSIDLGMLYKGLNTDLSWTYLVDSQDEFKVKFLNAGKRALDEAVKKAVVGNRVSDISLAIQNEVKKDGFRPVRALTGHGVGRELHEDPFIPCFFDVKNGINKSPVLEEGMTLAIEVIYTAGSHDLVLDDDGWTIKTKDGKIAGLFEKTVAITASGSLLLTN